MEQIEISAAPRQERGKGPARRLRRAGSFPAIVYGGDEPPQPIALESSAFELMLHRGLSSSSLLNLRVEGEGKGAAQLVVLRAMDRDPVSHGLNHADFYRVRLDQQVEFEIPVHGIGTSPGIKAGGILEHANRTVTVRCLPTDVPHHIEVSLEELDFGHTIHLGDITLPAGVEAVSDAHTVLFSVVAPRAAVAAGAEAAEGEVEGEAEAEAPAEEAPTEPEVIGKGKKEDEGEG
jgi:large subunit ribosomal protein L25